MEYCNCIIFYLGIRKQTTQHAGRHSQPKWAR